LTHFIDLSNTTGMDHLKILTSTFTTTVQQEESNN